MWRPSPLSSADYFAPSLGLIFGHIPILSVSIAQFWRSRGTMTKDPQPAPSYTKTFVMTDTNLTVLLYNFDIGAARLKPAHELYLTTNLPQYLSADTTVTIVGVASPSGPDSFNFDLSRWRAETVQAYVQAFETPGYFLQAAHLEVGEAAARIAGLKDGTEDGRWRGVLLAL